MVCCLVGGVVLCVVRRDIYQLDSLIHFVGGFPAPFFGSPEFEMCPPKKTLDSEISTRHLLQKEILNIQCSLVYVGFVSNLFSRSAALNGKQVISSNTKELISGDSRDSQ